MTTAKMMFLLGHNLKIIFQWGKGGGSVFLIHINTEQLPRQTLRYIKKNHYHVGKKLPIFVLYGTQIVYFNPIIFQLEHLPYRKYCYSFPRPQTGNQFPLAIMYNLLIFLLSCRFEQSRRNFCQAHKLLIFYI